VLGQARGASGCRRLAPQGARPGVFQGPAAGRPDHRGRGRAAPHGPARPARAAGPAGRPV